MTDGRNFFDQPIKNDKIPQKTGRLLDYAYFKNYYKMIGVDLSKQQVLDADSRAIQQITFIANLTGNTRIYFILEGTKETVLEFSQGTVKVL